jgi:GNAT superfamily N-acetyltransferase
MRCGRLEAESRQLPRETTLVALQMGGHWMLRALKPGDASLTLDLLQREPMANIYLISRILDDGLADGCTIGISLDSELIAVASLTSNVVFYVSRDISTPARQTAIALLAERIVNRGIIVRAMISEERLVEELWTHLRSRLDPPTVVRLTQPVYVLNESGSLFPPLERVRFAAMADLDALVPACAAMHHEEVGIDPLARDAVGYRERIRELISHRQAMVLIENGLIAFKTEFSAVTPEGVQLMGVWTHPRLRRRGLARAGLAEVCGEIVREGKKVTLFVNDFNTPAIELYESIGFERIGQNRALIW